MSSHEPVIAAGPIVFLVQPGFPDAEGLKQFLISSGFAATLLDSVQDAVREALSSPPIAFVATGGSVLDEIADVAGTADRILFGAGAAADPSGFPLALNEEELVSALQRANMVHSQASGMFALMQIRFIHRARQDLQQLLQKLDAGVIPEDLLRTLHRWSGVGGTLGLPEVSQAAARLEDRIHQGTTYTVEALRPGLETIAHLLSPSPDRPAAESAAAPLLQGQRFGLLGFSPEETDHIQALLEQARALVRRMEIEADPTGSSIVSGFDVMVISADLDSTEIEWLRPDAAHRPAAVLAVGPPEVVLHRIPQLRAFRHDILVAPWIPEDLIFRCYRLTLARWAPEKHAASVRLEPVILIADDDPSITTLIEITLQQYHMRAIIAGDGEQAVQLAISRRPDLILLDAVMPRSNGFEVLEKIRGQQETSSIPVIMVSASGQERDILRGLSLGANDYIVKPFHPPELMARLRRLLRKGD